jgi:hypothetical protein
MSRCALSLLSNVTCCSMVSMNAVLLELEVFIRHLPFTIRYAKVLARSDCGISNPGIPMTATSQALTANSAALAPLRQPSNAMMAFLRNACRADRLPISRDGAQQGFRDCSVRQDPHHRHRV